MANVEELQKLGWHLSPEGIEECMEDGKKSTEDIIRMALDLDLKDISKKSNDTGGKLKQEHFEGPYVLQVQKLRNVSAPKDNEESQAAPPMYKLILTDGQSTYPAVEKDKINKLSLDTPPGTKVLLRGKVPVASGFLLLNKNNCEILGGRVDKLVDSWQLKRTLANQSRYNVGREGGGPPPFIPFGQRRSMYDAPTNRRDNFKSLDTSTKEKKSEDTEFEQQRQRTIAAVTDLKEEQQGKVYGSGSMIKPNDRDVASIVDMGFTTDQANAALKQNNNSVDQAVDALLNHHDTEQHGQTNRWAGRNSRSGGYGNSGPTHGGGTGNGGNYRQQQQNDRIDYRNEQDHRNDYKPERNDDRRMDRNGERNGRVEKTDRYERSDKTEKYERSERTDRNERPDRSERGGRSERPERGRGRRGRDEEDDDDYRNRPSGPATLFDFLITKNPDAVKSDSHDNHNKEHRVRDSSKSSDNSDKRSSVSGSGGPPNLPPRLVRQQKQKEEEARARRQGPPPGPPATVQQRPPPPPPYAVQAQNRQNRSRTSQGDPRHTYQDQMEDTPPNMRGPQQYQSNRPTHPQQYPTNRPNHPQQYPSNRPTHPQQYQHNRPNQPQNKRVYNANTRGPVQNKTLWNDNEGGRRGNYRDRQDYENQRYDHQRNYDNRRGPNPRYNNQRYDQRYEAGGYDNGYRGYNKDNQYGANNRQYNMRNSNHVDAPRPGYKRPQTQVPPSGEPVNQPEVDTSQPVNIQPEMGEVLSAEPQMTSVPSQNEGEGYVMVQQDDMVEQRTEYIDNGELIDPNAMVTVNEQQTMYMYQENGDVSQQPQPAPPPTGGYVQVTPQGLVSPLQQMTISGSAQMQTYQYPPGGVPHQLVVDQSGGMYTAAAPAMFSPTNMEYNQQPDSSTSMVNGSKTKNNMYPESYPSDATGKPVRQWKMGDYCMAKYWEDAQYYRAIVQQVDPSGNVCFVHFPDYGNVEQVVIKDIRPVPKTAWENNTLQMPSVGMMMAASQAGMGGGAVPPGIVIQNPPPISFVSGYANTEQPYPGAVMTLPPGTVAYAPVATTLATTGAQQYSKPAVQQVYVTQQAPPSSQVMSQAPPTSQQTMVTAMTQAPPTSLPVVTAMAQAPPSSQPVVTALTQTAPTSQAAVTAMTQSPTTQAVVTATNKP